MLETEWNPVEVARRVEMEAERWWREGWVFVRADTDALMESVALTFEKEWPLNPG